MYPQCIYASYIHFRSKRLGTLPPTTAAENAIYSEINTDGAEDPAGIETNSGLYHCLEPGQIYENHEAVSRSVTDTVYVQVER